MIVVLKDLQELLSQGSRIVITTCVRHGLPAAGLGCGKFDHHVKSFQQLENRDANLRIELIDVTGNKQPDAFHG